MAKYKFNPDDFLISSNSKRLSTCSGKYLDKPYCITLKCLLKHFMQTCPYHIISNRSPMEDFLQAKYLERRVWCENNLKGYWYELSENELDRRKTVWTSKKIFIFQYDSDAILFKLSWN